MALFDTVSILPRTPIAVSPPFPLKISMRTELFPPSSQKRSSTVVEQIWSRLRRLILHGTLPPGSRLVELDIAAQSSASQASVREALHRLERDGLVIRRGRRGTFVTEVDPEKMLEIFHVRSTVEELAVRRAVKKIDAQRMDELEGLVVDMLEAGRQGDVIALVEADLALHRRICRWADHPSLMRVWELLSAQMERFLILYDVAHFGDLTEVATNHYPLLDALRAGQADCAAAAIRAHVLIGAPPSDPEGYDQFFDLLQPRQYN